MSKFTIKKGKETVISPLLVFSTVNRISENQLNSYAILLSFKCIYYIVTTPCVIKIVKEVYMYIGKRMRNNTIEIDDWLIDKIAILLV